MLKSTLRSLSSSRVSPNGARLPDTTRRVITTKRPWSSISVKVKQVFQTWLIWSARSRLMRLRMNLLIIWWVRPTIFLKSHNGPSSYTELLEMLSRLSRLLSTSLNKSKKLETISMRMMFCSILSRILSPITWKSHLILTKSWCWSTPSSLLRDLLKWGTILVLLECSLECPRIFLSSQQPLLISWQPQSLSALKQDSNRQLTSKPVSLWGQRISTKSPLNSKRRWKLLQESQ